MNKKKVIALTGAVLAIVIIIIFAVNYMGEHKKSNQEMVFDKSSSIKLKDIETYYDRVDFNDQNAKDYFKEKIINPYTLKFFMFLDDNFKEINNADDLLKSVHKYLNSIMPLDQAEKLFALYKTYLSYQLSLGEKTKDWGLPRTTEESVAFLHKLQDYRREVFGREVADALFGASVKAEEYPIRRMGIVNDKNMYGAEKEQKIQQLNQDMWGDEAGAVDAYAMPYTKYQEKLVMYKKDLSEMNENEKKAQIHKFREEIFTPDQVQRLDDVDQAIADNKKKEDDYYVSENAITSDPNLSKEEKYKKIQELQNQTFGDEADAFRRREAIRKASEEAFKKK